MKKNKKIFSILGIVILIVLIIGLVLLVNKLNEKQETNKVNEELSSIFKENVIEPEDDVYSKQEDADKAISEALKNKDYTIDSPYVMKNPYGISPLTALVIFQTSEDEEVTINVNGYTQKFEATKSHAIPVYGLIAGKSNTVTISTKSKTKTLSIDMSSVRDDLNLNVLAGQGVNLGNDIYVVTTPGDEGLYGFNTKGELVWRLTETFGASITVLDNGHLLLSNTEYILSYSRIGLVEIDFLGKIYNVYDLEGGYHNESIVLDNGNYLVLSSDITRGTISDVIVEINPKDGKIVNTIDVKAIVEKVSTRFVDNLKIEDWAAINSLYYDKKSDSIIISLGGRNSVMSIGYKTKKINWIFGEVKNWNQDFNTYFLEYDGVYPMLTNSVSLNKEGNLVLFNNNMDGTLTEDALCTNYINNRSSGQVYKIDNKKISLVSEFNDNNSFYSYAVSNYNELDNGNYLLFSAWEFGDGTMLKEGCTMNSNTEGLHSIIYELDKDKNIMFKATFNGGSYRANKVNLYKSNKEFSVSSVNYYNTLSSKIYETLDNKDLVDKLKNAEVGNFSVTLTKDLLNINAVFQTNEEVYVLLVGKDGKTHKYLSKAKGSYLQPVVNLRNIDGTYALFIVINDTYYNLDQTYNF